MPHHIAREEKKNVTYIIDVDRNHRIEPINSSHAFNQSFSSSIANHSVLRSHIPSFTHSTTTHPLPVHNF